MSDADHERRDELASLLRAGRCSIAAEQAELAALVAADPAFAADVRALAGTAVGLAQRRAADRSARGAAHTRAHVGDRPASPPATATPAATADGSPSGDGHPDSPRPSPHAQRADVRVARRRGLAGRRAAVSAPGHGSSRTAMRELDARLAAAQDEVGVLQRTLGTAQSETSSCAAQATVLVAPDVAARRSRRPAGRARRHRARLLEPIARHGLHRDVAAAPARRQGLSVLGDGRSTATRSAPAS